MQTLKLTKKYEQYLEYKDSGVEWLGDVPKNWNVDIIQHLFTKVKRLGFGDEELLSVYRDRGVIIKSSRDDNHNKASEDLSLYQLVNKGDLAINKMKAWQGSIAVSEYKGIVSPAYFICKPLTKNDSRFMHYLLRSDIYIKQYERNSGGVRNDQWDLNYERFRKLEIAIPQINEQERISKYLNEKTVLIDQIIEKKEILIEKLEEKRNATISKQIFEDVGKDWKIQKIKHLVLTIESGIWGDNPLSDQNDIKCLRIADFDYDNFSFSTVETVRNNPDLNERKVLRDGDILMEKSGGGEKTPVGRAILFSSEERMVCANFIDKVRVDKDKILPEFLVLYLSVLYAGRVNTKYIKQNTGIQNMDIKEYFGENVSYPDIEIQKNLTKFVNAKIKDFNKAISDVEKTIKTLKEFKTALISSVVTGKIKV